MLHIQVDRVAEKARLNKEAERLRGEIEKSKTKLSNPSFLERARPDVVEQERKRLTDHETKLADVTAQLAKLG
jgi:valyl-tRNA synthetase